MTKTELNTIRKNKIRNSDLNILIESTAVISKIAPGSITTYDGQILDANIITLRVKNGYLF
jgi:hypothetical protein